MSKRDIELIAEVINDLPLPGTVIPHMSGENQRRMIALRFSRKFKELNPSFIEEPFLDRAIHGLGRKEQDGKRE